MLRPASGRAGWAQHDKFQNLLSLLPQPFEHSVGVTRRLGVTTLGAITKMYVSTALRQAQGDNIWCNFQNVCFDPPVVEPARLSMTIFITYNHKPQTLNLSLQALTPIDLDDRACYPLGLIGG